MAVLKRRSRTTPGKDIVRAASFPRFLGGLIPLAICALLSSQVLTAQGLTEHEIQAGFLFNFTKFVEWPAAAYADPSAAMILGIVGANPFGSVLDEIVAGKSVNGRAVAVKHFKEGQDVRGCQILFVGLTDRKLVLQVLEKVKGASVLTVGEGSEFIKAGGAIAFRVEQNKVRLEIDLGAASEAHLKISAKLIAVARLTPTDAKGRN